MIDLRSDTVTKPTPGMKDAMFAAEVGDDVFGEDPSINALEDKCAALFGKDSAIFCPSGTMTNQIGLRILTRPFEEVICYEGSHVYLYEGGGLAGNSGLSTALLKGDRGRLSVAEVESAINPEDPHRPHSAVISLENTVNKGGGSYYTLDEITSISSLARKNGLKMHLDGARLMNALAETGEKPEDYGKHFDTISLCLSKGLGAPVGSVLIVDRELENEARRTRKVFGGGMRQAGYLAAAGIYALDHHIQRLTEDHTRARTLGDSLIKQDWVKNVLPVDTNIVIFELKDGLSNSAVLNKLAREGLLAVAFGPGHIRLVTHLDFNDNHLDQTLTILDSFQP